VPSLLDQLNEVAGLDLTPGKVRELVHESIATVAELPPEDLQDDQPLESYGLDSFALTEVLVEIEDRLGVEFPVEMLEQLDETPEVRTLGDFFELLTADR
jgi:acyl carrier protein